MMLRSIIGPAGHNLKWLNQTRYIRPTVKIAKDKFQLTLDVRNFCRDEIRVKARTDYVVVEGKQERKLQNGIMIRQFVRKFRLPDGCSPCRMESKLSENGILTVTAYRTVCDETPLCERHLPINFKPPDNFNDSFFHVDDFCKRDPCEVNLELRAEKNDAKPPDNQNPGGKTDQNPGSKPS